MKLAALAFVAILVAACDGCHPADAPAGDAPAASASTSSDFKATSPNGPRVVVATDTMTLAELTTKALVGECADAMLVWGDVSVDDTTGKAIRIEAGGKGIDGYLVCQANAETFLRKQAKNPRMAGRGGTATVHFRDGQLRMIRRWSAGEVALGDLSTLPEGVFQKGEALAALVELDDGKLEASLIVPMLANIPKAFVFGMWPLK
ncbi:hypothetical protein BH09MYX1_BH09MYX1_04470 [soil metagenome]